ncbi:hypothetical protein FKM82_007663 [Ascaphus truei]
MAENVPAAAGIMQQDEGDTSGDTNPIGTEKWRRLPEIQKDIYTFLKDNEPQKALAIAKAVKKKTAKDINPSLYDMKSNNLLSQNEDTKHWTIKQEHNAGMVLPYEKNNLVVTTMADSLGDANATQNRMVLPYEKNNLVVTTMADSLEDANLTQNQREICKCLLERGAHGTLDIAKALNKTSKKDVNPDLYKLKEMGILCLDNQSKCWSMRQNDSAGHSVASLRSETANAIVNNFFILGNSTNHIYNAGNCDNINVSESQNIQIGDHNCISTDNKENTDAYRRAAESPSCAFPVASECQPQPQHVAAVQDVSVSRSKLKNCILGHSNEMNVSESGDSGFEENDLRQEPHGAERAAQIVTIANSIAQNVLIGNFNIMNIDPVVRDGIFAEAPATSPNITEYETELPQTSSPNGWTRYLPAPDISDICRELEKATLDEHTNTDAQDDSQGEALGDFVGEV